MAWNLRSTHIQEGDLVQLVGMTHKNFIITTQAGAELHTHRGVVKHDDLIGQPWGIEILSHMGSPFFAMQPALGDLLRETKRNTQILYPKEIGYLLLNMGIGEGQHVLEAGTGSGAMTTALAFAVGKSGKVTTYENREESQRLAKKNLAMVGLADRVNFKLGDISVGFEETGVDALFLDVSNPYDYIPQVRSALKLGGFFGCILPTTGQVSKLVIALRQNQFAFIDVCEIMLRFWKPEPERLRPTDRMVAHTGFLIFGRPVLRLKREEEDVVNTEDVHAIDVEEELE